MSVFGENVFYCQSNFLQTHVFIRTTQVFFKTFQKLSSKFLKFRSSHFQGQLLVTASISQTDVYFRSTYEEPLVCYYCSLWYCNIRKPSDAREGEIELQEKCKWIKIWASNITFLITVPPLCHLSSSLSSTPRHHVAYILNKPLRDTIWR